MTRRVEFRFEELVELVIVPQAAFLKFLPLFPDVPESQTRDRLLRGQVTREVADQKFVQLELTKGELDHALAGLGHDSLSLMPPADPVRQLRLVVRQGPMRSHQPDQTHDAAERAVLEYGPGDAFAGISPRDLVLQ